MSAARWARAASIVTLADVAAPMPSDRTKTASAIAPAATYRPRAALTALLTKARLPPGHSPFCLPEVVAARSDRLVHQRTAGAKQCQLPDGSSSICENDQSPASASAR